MPRWVRRDDGESPVELVLETYNWKLKGLCAPVQICHGVPQMVGTGDSLIQSCIRTENLLFIVSSCNNLFKLKGDKDEKGCLHAVFKGHGCDSKDSGVHFVGKGAATSVASASTSVPSMPAICNRCNWSRGTCDGWQEED